MRQVATSLRAKFRQRIEAANKLKTAIENLYERGPPKTPTYSDCCDINSGEVDIRFKQKVGLRQQIRADVPSMRAHKVTRARTCAHANARSLARTKMITRV